jgi:hypothetical protein
MKTNTAPVVDPVVDPVDGNFSVLATYCQEEDVATEAAKAARKAAAAAAKAAVKEHCQKDVTSASSALASSAQAIGARFPVSNVARTKISLQAVGLIAQAARKIVKG